MANRYPERSSLAATKPGDSTEGCVIGIDMGASSLRFALADLQGHILDEASEPVRPEDGPAKTVGQIKKGIERLLRATHGRRTLRSLAIGVPGPVDPQGGTVAFANNLPGWRKVRLGRELKDAFGVPVFLENDANMAAIGEHWCGVARGVDNFVFIALGTGIGSGIFVDGKLHRGRTGSAGELYLLNLEWPRWNEDFGDTGYFEKYVSGMGIAAQGREVLPNHRQTPAGLREDRDARFVFEALERGNAAARAVLEKTFTMLGVGVANIVAILDPDLVVFGGGISRGAPDLLLSTVKRVVGRIQPNPPHLLLSSLQDKAQIYGAICSALSLCH